MEKLPGFVSTQTVPEEVSAIGEQTGMKPLSWTSKKNSSIELTKLLYF
jgi:hypothetical protein